MGLSREFHKRHKGVARRSTLTEIRPRFGFGQLQRSLIARLGTPVRNLACQLSLLYHALNVVRALVRRAQSSVVHQGMILELRGFHFGPNRARNQHSIQTRLTMSSSVDPGDGTHTICGSKLGSDQVRLPRKVVLLIQLRGGALRAAEGFVGGGAIPSSSTSK